MARIVLVHGAFAGGWSWERVTGPLEAAGHSVSAPDLPGAGSDRTPVAGVTLDAYAARIGDVLADGDEPAVLVGHSMGGVAITHAAARHRVHVRQLVYVGAFLPGEGDSLVGLTELPEGAGDMVQAAMVVTGEPPVAALSRDAAHTAFFHRCDTDTAAVALDRLRPQPLAPFVTPVSLGEGGVEALPPRSYVVCSDDRSLPPPLQRRMARERADGTVTEIDTDHSPFFSATEELVALLDRLARS